MRYVKLFPKKRWNNLDVEPSDYIVCKIDDKKRLIYVLHQFTWNGGKDTYHAGIPCTQYPLYEGQYEEVTKEEAELLLCDRFVYLL